MKHTRSPVLAPCSPKGTSDSAPYTKLTPSAPHRLASPAWPQSPPDMLTPKDALNEPSARRASSGPKITEPISPKPAPVSRSTPPTPESVARPRRVPLVPSPTRVSLSTLPEEKESSSTRAFPHTAAGGDTHRTLPFVYVAATSRSPDHFSATPSKDSNTDERPNRHCRSGRSPRSPEPCTAISPPP